MASISRFVSVKVCELHVMISPMDDQLDVTKEM